MNLCYINQRHVWRDRLKLQNNHNNAIYLGGADMAITAENVKTLIVALGFAPLDGETDVFYKKYAQHDGLILLTLLDHNFDRPAVSWITPL